ncbi:cobalamin biosynthesis protein [Luteococcus peritonei]|uniref:Cobalamin biosynthesis protein CobD n=1 Tax=Luteococcus peritonei TaxID=88874 RepID=A0ABW4RV26_9ACTN
MIGRAVGLALGTAADRLVPDPQHHHPVAWFGSWAAWLERHTWRDDRAAGALHVALCLAPLAALGLTAEAVGRRHPLARVATTALATWAVTGGASLAREGRVMADHLSAGDLASARARLGHLCGRLSDELDEPELARATLESVAENTADAVVAPLVWGALAGVPGLLLHRGINTLDAMVGHHNERYEHFGTAAARLDDAACWPAARITGALACLLAGERRSRAWQVMRRDAHDHPSPNGGWCESAFAGALGVQLGGRNVYPGGRVEHRGLLGDGPRPTAADLRAGVRLECRIQWAATALAAAALLAVPRKPAARRPRPFLGGPVAASTGQFPGLGRVSGIPAAGSAPWGRAGGAHESTPAPALLVLPRKSAARRPRAHRRGRMTPSGGRFPGMARACCTKAWPRPTWMTREAR